METIRTLLDRRADAQGSATFLIAPENERTVSFGELRDLAMNVAGRLDGLGLGAGGKVAFLLDNGLWTAALFLGTMYSGRVTVPLNAVAGNDPLAYAIDHSDARVIFVSDEYRRQYAAVLAQVDESVRIVPVSEEDGPRWPEGSGRQPRGEDLPPVSPEDDALLIYTSGTTGVPKGVLLPHRSVVAGGTNTAGAHQLRETDRALCVLPLYHINAEMVSVVAPLVSGGSVVMPRRFSASRFWPLISRHRCTWFSVVPTIIAYLLEQAEREGFPEGEGEGLTQLRFGRSASAPLSPEMHRDFEDRFRVPVVETMGLSETAAQILSNPMPPIPPRYGSPGKPYGNEARVVDKAGREVPDGVRGELMIRGPNVMKGYYKNPEATREAFDEQGWLHTGDLAYRDSEGYFFITGRLKELIIKGGENIAPREIDEVLYQHPAVLEAAAFGVPDKSYGEEVMACVTLKPGARCVAAELEAFCVERLGRYKSPREVTVLDSLPKGPSGKIQRRKLAESMTDVPG